MNTRSPERAEMSAYKVVRCYEGASRHHQTIAAGLTLAEAQAYCHDPDNCSLTCRTEVGKCRTRQFGQWFDGYVRETKHSNE
ncbi:MAG: hypothetical protein ACXV5Q_06130 [Frankiaceae bacterium]